jgi:hypothetical protein
MMTVKINGKARIKITHSERGTTSVEKTWAALGFEWFGAAHPDLGRILAELHESGVSSYTENGATLHMVALDPMYISTETQEQP